MKTIKKPIKTTGLTIAELRETLGVTRQTIQNWVADGLPRAKGRSAKGRDQNTFDLGIVRAWLVQKGNLKAGTLKAEPAPPGTTSEPMATWAEAPATPQDSEGLCTAKIQLALAELRRRTAHAEKLEFDLAARRGKFLPADEVRAGRLARIASAKSVLLQLPAKCAARCEGRDAREIEAILMEEVKRALEELARA